MTANDYWEECLANSCEENGVALTPEQLRAIAQDIGRGHESYGMAFGYPQGNPERAEIKRLEKALATEREKVTCRECKGTGTIHFQGPYHGSISQCDKCQGTGRHT